MRLLRWRVVAPSLILCVACSGTPQVRQEPLPTPPGSSAAGTAVPSQPPSSATTPTTSARESAPRSPGTGPATGTVRKVLVFIEENHSLDQMKAGMPYTFGVAEEYGYATNYYAVAHPSLPNYLAIAGGSTFGVQDDDGPSVHVLNGPSVFDQALAAGKTAAVYAEGMPGNCALTDGGDAYAVKHNPWPYFVAERQHCLAHDMPVTALDAAIRDGGLPNVGMVVPNTCHDGHDCTLTVADGWFKEYLTKVLDGPDWRSGHLAVVLTADEDDRSQDNKVLTVVIHPSQRHHVVGTKLDHYSLTRLYEDIAGVAHLGNAASAASMSDAFGLPMP
jgi:phosphatidylinositol-3-phosphatase